VLLEQLELNINGDLHHKSVGVLESVKLFYQYVVKSKWLVLLDAEKSKLSSWNYQDTCFYGVKMRINCGNCQPELRHLKEI